VFTETATVFTTVDPLPLPPLVDILALLPPPQPSAKTSSAEGARSSSADAMCFIT
jgi:hypothetical protein